MHIIFITLFWFCFHCYRRHFLGTFALTFVFDINYKVSCFGKPQCLVVLLHQPRLVKKKFLEKNHRAYVCVTHTYSKYVWINTVNIHFFRRTCTPAHFCSPGISQTCDGSAVRKIVQVQVKSFKRWSRETSERGESVSSVILTMACLLVLLGMVWMFQKLLNLYSLHRMMGKTPPPLPTKKKSPCCWERKSKGID